jgi:hypothetical protein
MHMPLNDEKPVEVVHTTPAGEMDKKIADYKRDHAKDANFQYALEALNEAKTAILDNPDKQYTIDKADIVLNEKTGPKTVHAEMDTYTDGHVNATLTSTTANSDVTITANSASNTITMVSGGFVGSIKSASLAEALIKGEQEALQGQFTPEEARAFESAKTMLANSMKNHTTHELESQIIIKFQSAEKEAAKGL